MESLKETRAQALWRSAWLEFKDHEKMQSPGGWDKSWQTWGTWMLAEEVIKCPNWYHILSLELMLCRSLWDSWAQRPYSPPLLVDKAPACMTFPEFQRTDSKKKLIRKEQPQSHLRQDKRDWRRSSRLGDPQFSSFAQWCPTLFYPMDCSTPDFPAHHQLPELAQTHIHWVNDAIQPSHPLLQPSVFPSIRVFSNESVLLTRWPKYWSFSFIISPSKEYSGLISFRIYWESNSHIHTQLL